MKENKNINSEKKIKINLIGQALAKSNGVKLINHNRNVAIVSRYIATKMLVEPSEEQLKTIEISGLLHDIGKMTEEFQKMLRGQVKKPKNNFLHNEIGWAFLYTYLDTADSIFDFTEVVNLIHWHHGIYRKLSKSTNETIIDSLSDENIELMKGILVELMGEKHLYVKDDKSRKTTPQFYYSNGDIINDYKEYNKLFSISRTCLITADRIVSVLEEENNDLVINYENVSNQVESKMEEYLNKSTSYNILMPDGYVKERFKLQKDIAESCDFKSEEPTEKNNTTIVKAPSGFGKTMVGLIWSSLNNKKTIWVVPRNIIAKSIYKSIIEELEKMNLSHVKVELFLTGKREKCNFKEKKDLKKNNEFNADIIVTNIDNFEAPSIRDNIADRLFLTHSANIVFDEYHEFLSDLPLFACFENLMKARHRNTESRTLLLSATPIDISSMWDSIDNKTKISPNNTKHHPAIHKREYLIRVKDEFIHDRKGSELIIFNSIFESQIHLNKIPTATLYHSKFDKKSKEDKFNYLMENYSKNSPMNLDKSPIISALMIQASLDISVLNLYESVQSPEATLQRIGRTGRFEVDYVNGELTINVFKVRSRLNKEKFSRSENAVDRLLYDDKLTELWYKEISRYDGKKMTLDEFYVLYNKHVHENRDDRKKFFKKKLSLSLDRLAKVYPRKFSLKNKKDDIIIAGGNKLRSLGDEIFYLVNLYDVDKKDINKKTYVGPFPASIRVSFEKDFNEEISKGIQTRLFGSMKTIMYSDQNEFDYSEILKNKKRIRIDEIRHLARKSDTPYIRYDEVYHPKYGLIDIKRLKELGL